MYMEARDREQILHVLSAREYGYTRVQAVGNTHARDARRIFIYIHGDISISFTAADAFFPTPTPSR